MAQRVCPFWIGYFLLSPFRKIAQNPDKILKKYLNPGMKVLDFGSAMGFFSIPMANMVNPEGKVICVDLQEPMLRVLTKRAKKSNVSHLIETHVCSADSLNLSKYYDKIDFVLAFAVAHEVPDKNLLFKELSKVLKSDGKLLFSEPSGHISEQDFKKSLAIAIENNFNEQETISIRRSYSILLNKK
jgi:ubiquinone/menaquinone biosynthesis C-methylase UbiE